MHEHHILTVEQMYRVDELALAHVKSSFALMQNAAAAACKEVLLELPDKATVGILCGAGNNGGDGFVLASLLLSEGISVVCVFCAPAKTLDNLAGDAQLAYQQFVNTGGSALLTLDDLLTETSETLQESPKGIPQVIPKALANCELLVDAVLGAGLSRPVSGQLATLFDAINQRRDKASTRVISIDLPSGISGNSAQVCGCALQADVTVTFFRPVSYTHLTLPTIYSV